MNEKQIYERLILFYTREIRYLEILESNVGKRPTITKAIDSRKKEIELIKMRDKQDYIVKSIKEK